MTDDQKAMAAERQRVSKMLEQVVSEIVQTGGNIRFFNAAFLTAAVQMTVEVEGIEGVESAISKIGQREMIRNGKAGSC